MNLLRHLLDADPACPRLTVYNETNGSRLDFSATTLDNWAAKVANMLLEEFDLEPGSTVGIDLPGSWQEVAIVLGSLASRMNVELGAAAASTSDIYFCEVDNVPDDAPDDTVVVTSDPFGRGVGELGLTLPEGTVDFGPTVRMYGDQFFGDSPALPELFPTDGEPRRSLTTQVTTWKELVSDILEPLASGGSVVVVLGPASAERLAHIAQVEKADS